MSEKNIKHIHEQDTALRQAIARRERRRPQMPSGLNERVMQQAAKPRHRSFRWLSIAASIVAVCLLGYTLYINIHQSEQEHAIAENDTSKDTSLIASTATTQTQQEEPQTDVQEVIQPSEPQLVAQVTTKQKQEPQKPVQQIIAEDSLPVYMPTDEAEPTVQYASVAIETDTAYKAPGKMDEFIEKMASYGRAEAGEIECLHSSDTLSTSTIYVFEEKQDVEVFDRLLRMAIWYDNTTPGYFLSFSQKQFLFELHDSRRGLKYLWLAERLQGDIILLYSTHTPLGTPFNTSCYLEFRNKKTNTFERAL